MEAILTEQGFQQSGCSSNECLVQAGMVLGVQLMVGGTVGRLGYTFTVDVRLFNVETAEIITAETRTHQGAVDGLLTVMSDIAATLAGDRKDSQIQQQPDNGWTDGNPVVALIENNLDQLKKDIAGEPEHRGSLINHETWSPLQLAFIYPQQILPERVKIYCLRLNLIYEKTTRFTASMWD